MGCLFSAFLLVITVFAVSFQLSSAQSPMAVRGVMTSDAVWIKTNSPYNLTGNFAISEGVTLTIEKGVTVNFNGYSMRVNGTLNANGTNSEKIHFNGGLMEFTPSIRAGNIHTGMRCIIQNAAINTEIWAGSVSAMIINSTITSGYISVGENSIVSQNVIAVPFIDYNSTPRFGLAINGAAQVTDNIISGAFTEATLSIGNGLPIIERNIISNEYGYNWGSGYDQVGISIMGETSSPIIKNNTVTKCANGISIVQSATPIIDNNNIDGITNYNLRTTAGTNHDASNNWWGTTNTVEIDQKILDFNDDFNLGKLNFIPFLTKPNPQSIPNPNATPSLDASISASQMPDQSAVDGSFLGLSWLVLSAIVVIVLIMSVFVGLFLHRRR